MEVTCVQITEHVTGFLRRKYLVFNKILISCSLLYVMLRIRSCGPYFCIKKQQVACSLIILDKINNIFLLHSCLQTTVEERGPFSLPTVTEQLHEIYREFRQWVHAALQFT